MSRRVRWIRRNLPQNDPVVEKRGGYLGLAGLRLRPRRDFETEKIICKS